MRVTRLVCADRKRLIQPLAMHNRILPEPVLNQQHDIIHNPIVRLVHLVLRACHDERSHQPVGCQHRRVGMVEIRPRRLEHRKIDMLRLVALERALAHVRGAVQVRNAVHPQAMPMHRHAPKVPRVPGSVQTVRDRDIQLLILLNDDGRPAENPIDENGLPTHPIRRRPAVRHRQIILLERISRVDDRKRENTALQEHFWR